jgi:pilus assembly protein Flp/PilA
MFPLAESARITQLWRLRVKFKQKALKFWSDESGATAIEYGLIAAGISLAIIAVVNGLGTNLNDKFTSINNSLK